MRLAAEPAPFTTAPAARLDMSGSHERVATLMDREHLVAPVIVVLLDCAGGDVAASNTEVFVAGPEGDDLLAIVRPLRLADAPQDAMPWQRALAVLDDAFSGEAPLDALSLFEGVTHESIAEARRQRRPDPVRGSHVSVRRYFEALGAIGLGRPFDRGKLLAWDWNRVARQAERGRYRFTISRATRPWRLDLRPCVRDAVFELVGGEPASHVSARFLNTIAAALADVVRGAAAARGRSAVLLAGSCFRGTGLAARVREGLTPDFQVIQEP